MIGLVSRIPPRCLAAPRRRRGLPPYWASPLPEWVVTPSLVERPFFTCERVNRAQVIDVKITCSWILSSARNDRNGALRSGLRERDAADLIHALMSPEVYRLLVTDRGWTAERYEDWLATALLQQLT